MYIIDKISLDKSGRISLKNYFQKQIPTIVDIAYNSKTAEIIIKPHDENSGFIARRIDSKNRISLPNWLKTLFIEHSIYLVVDQTGNRKLQVIDSL